MKKQYTTATLSVINLSQDHIIATSNPVTEYSFDGASMDYSTDYDQVLDDDYADEGYDMIW